MKQILRNQTRDWGPCLRLLKFEVIALIMVLMWSLGYIAKKNEIVSEIKPSNETKILISQYLSKKLNDEFKSD